MPKIVSVEQMRQIERAADQAGHSYASMMDHAGRAVAEHISGRLGPLEGRSLLVLAGSGNNGGDGLVAADLLAQAGMQVSVYLTKERSADDPHLRKLRERGTLIAVADQDQRSRVLRLQVGRAQLVLDAVLGTGFRLPLQGTAREVLGVVKRGLAARPERVTVVAVDCPSGLDCDTGEVAEETLAADLTVTLAAVKPGLLRFPGAGYVGQLVVGDIGLPADLRLLEPVQLELLGPVEVRPLLPARPGDSHKGTFGRVLVVAGSANYPGAALLAARSAYRGGAGLVTLAGPASLQAALAGELPEATWIPLPHEDGAVSPGAVAVLEPEWERCQAILIGPGLGQAKTTLEFLSALLASQFGDQPSAGGRRRPAWVVDADGLRLLGQLAGWTAKLPEGSVLTPHPGEMSHLTRKSKAEIQADRVAAARVAAAEWRQVVVLKGAHTVIADPDGKAAVLPFATPALARAGTGDVLAGLLTGLRAQGLSGFAAACLGGYLHGRAGELAARSLGTPASLLAGEVTEAIPAALAELEAYRAG